MGFFKSWRSHYFAGWLYGVTMARESVAERKVAIWNLDLWAYNREWQQNLKANHPNAKLSEHQTREAMAWGAGARAAAGVFPPYPSPPYEEGARW